MERSSSRQAVGTMLLTNPKPLSLAMQPTLGWTRTTRIMMGLIPLLSINSTKFGILSTLQVGWRPQPTKYKKSLTLHITRTTRDAILLSILTGRITLIWLCFYQLLWTRNAIQLTLNVGQRQTKRISCSK